MTIETTHFPNSSKTEAPESKKFRTEIELLSLPSQNEEKITSYLKTYHNIDISLLPPQIKKQFVEEMYIIFTELKNYKPSMVSDLKKIRETMSMGMESGKENSFYESLLIGNKLHARIIILKEVLRVLNGQEVSQEEKNLKKRLNFLSHQKGIYIKGFGLNFYGSLGNSGYESLEKMYGDKLMDIESMSEADLIILFRVLASLVPVAGDILGGSDDLRQANAGINYDGSIHSVGENMFMYLTGTLGVSIVGGRFAGLAKGPKLAQALVKIESIITKLSHTGNIEKLAKNEKFLQLLTAMKGKIPGIEGLLGKLTSSQLTTKLTDTMISDLGEEALIRHLTQANSQTVDLSEISGKNLARINQLITNNFPLVEIQRLIPGDKLVNINISGIKQINDIAGQEFCDLVVFKFKNILKRQFYTHNDALTRKGRIVKDDYKNMTFVTDAKEPLKMIFGNTKSKTEIMNEIMNSLEKDITQNARKMIQAQIDRQEIPLVSPAEFEKLVVQKVTQTKLVVMKYFDFGVGEAIIPRQADDITKLDTIRKSEISSRVGVTKSDHIEIKTFTRKELILHLEVALDTEKMIIENYRGKKFIFDGIPYNVIMDGPSGPMLSTELLRYVRKYPDKVMPTELSVVVKNYISNLNSSLDFISPVKYDLSPTGKEFETARKIDSQIRAGKIDIQYLTQSYKGGLTKKAFFEQTSNKPGTKVFIDIKDMGIDNLVDFNLRAKQILKLQEDLKAGKIDLHTYETMEQKLFLEAGKSVSDKFLEVQKRILKKYPDALISFGGDEIFLFIPERKLQFASEIESSIPEILAAANQKARIVIDINNAGTKTQESYAKLEQITKLSKMLEETLEKQLTAKGHILNGKLPDNTYIKINQSIREKIMNPHFHMDDFFKKVYGKMQTIDLTGNLKTPLQLGEVQDGIYLSIRKNLKNEVEIYLYN